MKQKPQKVFTLQALPSGHLPPMTALQFQRHQQLTNQLNQRLNPLSNQLNLPGYTDSIHPSHHQYFPGNSPQPTAAALQLPVIAEGHLNSPTFDPTNSFVFANVTRSPHDDLPVKRRHCQDMFFSIVFIAFIAFLGYFVADTVTSGRSRPTILLNGYDNFGNICGQENEVIPLVDLSGANMTSKRYLMVTLQSNVTIRTSCVSICPRNEFL